MSDNIVVLLAGAHPAHQKILRSFSKEIYFMLGPWFPGKQNSFLSKIFKYVYFAFFMVFKKPRIIFLEGAMPSAIIGLIIHLFLKDVRIISLVAEDAFYKALNRPKSFRSEILRIGFKIISGIIAIGPMIEKQITETGFLGPIFMMYPSIEENKIKKVSSICYQSERATVIHIGGGDLKYKGVDITLGVAKILKEADYTILGYDRKAMKVNIPENVSLPGRVKDVTPFLENSSLLIHPGRGDTFPVATLEAMAAGIPVMLSEETGTSEIIKDEMPLFVRKCNTEDFIEGVRWFLSLEQSEKERCSDKMKSLFRDALRHMDLKNRLSIQAVEEFIGGARGR